MSVPTCVVSIVISPLPSELDVETMNETFKGEIGEFERWFQDGQRKRGVLDPTPLLSLEHAILRSYLYYLCTKEKP